MAGVLLGVEWLVIKPNSTQARRLFQLTAIHNIRLYLSVALPPEHDDRIQSAMKYYQRLAEGKASSE